MASHSTHTYTHLPEQAQEDALHATRLLQVEERPFHRVTRNLLGKDSLLKWTPPRQLPSPPPEESQNSPLTTTTTTIEADKRQQFRSEILLDFAALSSSILRIHLIQSSNARERQRYASEKAKILDTAQAVRDNTVELRTQLKSAQRTLERRKGYDELAAKLIGVPAGISDVKSAQSARLKTRGETREEIARLEKEIEDLVAEAGEFEGVWRGRREAWERVVGEGVGLLDVVRGVVKEEGEGDMDKDEQMEDGEGGCEGGEGRSRMGTPVPGDGGRTPLPMSMSGMNDDGGARTPLPLPREQTPVPGGHTTPAPSSPARATNKFLEVDDAVRASSRAASPAAALQRDDVEMEEREGVTLDGSKETDTRMMVETVGEQGQTPDDGKEVEVEVMDES